MNTGVNVSRFFGANSRDALRQVREAMGPDAMIVSNKAIDGGVEILVLNETAVSAIESVAAQPAAARQAAAQANAAPASGRIGGDVLGAIGSLENRIDGLLWGDSLKRAPISVALYRELIGAGFSTTLARALLERLPEGIDRAAGSAWVRNELVSHLSVIVNDDKLLDGGGVYALVGPTGVGKTTTTAKLAARCVMRHGPDKVALLTTDGYRIGAHEQLLIYGRILGVTVHPVRDTAELARALDDLRNKHIVLIDTIGMSQRDRNVAEQAAMLCGAGRPVQRLLMLNAASQGDTLDEVAHAYRQGADGLLGCIITKLDEASHVGAAIDTAIRHRLPVYYVSNGQKVPENIGAPDGRELVDRAFASAGGKAVFAPSEADFAALWSAVSRSQGEGAAEDSASTASEADRRRRLLQAVATDGAADQARLLEAAMTWVQGDMACQLARPLWEETPSDDRTAGVDATELLLAAVRTTYSAGCDRYVLAVHGRARTPVPTATAGVVGSSLLATDRGVAWAAVAHDLFTTQGVLGSYPGAGARPLSQAPGVLMQRVDWLRSSLPSVPLVHLFDGIAAGLWSALAERPLAWMVRVPGTQRVLWQDGRIAVSALAKLLGFLPAGASPSHGAGAMRWVACTPVALPARNGQPMGFAGGALRLIVSRVLDAEGVLVQQDCAIACLPEVVDEAAAAPWLDWLDHSKVCTRRMAEAAQRLTPSSTGAQGRARHLTASGQVGVAAWRLETAHASPARALLPARGRKAPVDLLLRLYALQEIARP